MLRALLVLLTVLVLPVSAVDAVISVTASTQTVSNTANLTIVLSLATTTTTIRFTLPSQYTLHTNRCLVQKLSVSCTQSAAANQRTITFSGTFSSQQEFQFEVVNPLYESAFELFSYNGATLIGSGSIVLQTTAFQSVCTLASSSNVVAASATGTFSLNVLSVPAASVIYLTFQKQTAFQDIVTNIASVSCSSTVSVGASCQLSNSDTTTYSIQVAGLFPADYAGGTVSFTLSSMNNPPYNDTFSSIDLQLTDSSSNRIAYCSCQQQAPTVLATSNILYDGWNSAINQQSAVSLRVIPKTALPIGFQLLLVYPVDLTIQANPPAVQSYSSNSTTSILWLNNLTLSSGRVSLTASIKNPSSVKSLALTIYVAYNTTEFIESATIANLTLTIANISLGAVLTNEQVMGSTTMTLTGNFSDPIVNGYLTLTIDRGSFVCASSVAVNGTSISPISCNSTRMVLHCSAQNSTSITLGYTTPLSTLGATVNISSASSTNDSISFGTAQLSFISTVMQFTVTSSNLTFGARSTLSLVEVNNTYVSQQRRLFTITIPSNMNTVGLIVSGAGLVTYSFNSSTNVLKVDYNGVLGVNISNLQNPTLYDGNRNWSVSCTDALGYAVSSGSTLQSLEYTPTTASLTVQLDNTVIEQTTTSTIILHESLQHLPTDYIIVKIPSATIINPCIGSTCTLTNGAIRFVYASGLTFNSQLQSALAPGTYSCTVSYFTSAGVLLENGTGSYQLSPMTYTFATSFVGFMGQEGTLDLNLTTRPSTSLQLNYSVSNVMQYASCKNCTSSRLLLSGMVLYFTTANVTVTGGIGSVVYATGNVSISYPCSPGCHVCTATTCSQCFDSTYTNLVYFYNGTCLGGCPLATYTAGKNCIGCQQNCYSCNASGCQACSSGFYLHVGSCVSSCPTGFAVVGGDCVVKPIACPSGCLSCTTSDSCQKCNETYVLYQQQCYTSCPGNLTLQNGTCVVPPVPPVESTYFPFPFAVAAVSLLVILVCFKCFDKRSMILGNFISLCTFLELGSMLMFFSLLLIDKRDLVNQLLTYLCILSKVACNIFMLVYFMKKISRDEKFEEWLAADSARNRIRTFVMVMATTSSFQFYRFLYSRLLGLEIFFARFSSPLILKPMNYLTFAYAVVTSGSVIALAVISLLGQNAVHTSLFWACVEIMFIEVLLFLACLIDDRKKTDEHFDYQIYKIDNEFEAMGVPNAKEESMSELGGNLFQPISLHIGTMNQLEGSESQGGSNPQKSDGHQPTSDNKPKGSQLKNIFELDSKDESVGQQQNQKKDNNAETGNNSLQQEDLHESNAAPLSKNYSHRSIFRKKTLDEWNNFKSNKNRSGVIVGTDGKNKSLSPSRSQAQLQTAANKSHSIDKVGADGQNVSLGDDTGSAGIGKGRKLTKPGSYPKLESNSQEADGSSGINQRVKCKTPQNLPRSNEQGTNKQRSGQEAINQNNNNLQSQKQFFTKQDGLAGVSSHASLLEKQLRKSGQGDGDTADKHNNESGKALVNSNIFENNSQSALGRVRQSTTNLNGHSPGSNQRKSYYKVNPHHGNPGQTEKGRNSPHDDSKKDKPKNIFDNASNQQLDDINRDQTQKDIMEQLGGEEPLEPHNHDRNMLEQQLEESIKVVDEQGLEGIVPRGRSGRDEQDNYEPFFGGSNQNIQSAIRIINSNEGNEGQRPISPDFFEAASDNKLHPDNPNEYDEFTSRRKPKKKKKGKPSRYRNSCIEQIYLQRLSASVSKPPRKPELERDF